MGNSGSNRRQFGNWQQSPNPYMQHNGKERTKMITRQFREERGLCIRTKEEEEEGCFAPAAGAKNQHAI
jgi:hypothetical protein